MGKKGCTTVRFWDDEGLYGADPDLAWFLANSTAQNIYTANDPFSPLSFSQMVDYLRNQGLSLSWTPADTQNVLAEAQGQDIWFSGTGALISTNPLNAGDEDAISAHQLGNSNNGQSALTPDQLVALLINLSVAVPDADQGGTSNSTQIAELAGTVVGEADNGLTIAGGIHYMQAGEEATGALKWAGRVTGALSVGNNLYKAWNERHTNGWQSALHFSEAFAQTAFMIFGGEEVELAWNLGSIAIDTGVDYYNHSHGDK